MAESRIDFDKKCPNCELVYHEHSNDDIKDCVKSYYKEYDGTLAGVLSILGKEKLAKKWGQPSGDKRLWAFWPPGDGVPVTSTVPVRDFGIFVLINKDKDSKPVIAKPEKKSVFKKKDDTANAPEITYVPPVEEKDNG